MTTTPTRTARQKRHPEDGPRILFLSGGTALRKLSQHLIRSTHNSIHVITPFDSGGSSAHLRRAFAMPAMGDIRNRIMALADAERHGNPEVVALFAYRLPTDQDRDALAAELDSLASGRHPLALPLPGPVRELLCERLRGFQRRMPEDFDLRGASIGNLVLTAGYLANGRRMTPVISAFSELVQAHGVVRPVLDQHLTLNAELEDGTVITGQHRLTGKESAPINSRVRRVWISAPDDPATELRPPIQDEVRRLLARAELVCYPMGSFYSSVIANLLPQGVGRAIGANPCPKVFVPNTDQDPESLGASVAEQAEAILAYARKDNPSLATRNILNLVLVDKKNGNYPNGLDLSRLEGLGCRVMDARLVGPASAPYVDETLLAPLLLSLA